MRRFTQLVFDDFVVGTGNVYTNPVHEDLLGSADRLAIQAVAAQFTGTSPTLTVQVEHSSDGRNYSSKNGTPEVNGMSLSGSATVTASGTESGANPSAKYVRLRIALGGTTPQAQVKVYVTGRDRVP